MEAHWYFRKNIDRKSSLNLALLSVAADGPRMEEALPLSSSSQTAWQVNKLQKIDYGQKPTTLSLPTIQYLLLLWSSSALSTLCNFCQGTHSGYLKQMYCQGTCTSGPMSTSPIASCKAVVMVKANFAALRRLMLLTVTDSHNIANLQGSLKIIKKPMHPKKQHCTYSVVHFIYQHTITSSLIYFIAYNTEYLEG